MRYTINLKIGVFYFIGLLFLCLAMNLLLLSGSLSLLNTNLKDS